MKIENNKYIVTFCKEGGEIASFTNKETGMQYMYQGDSEYWSGKNPTLFPIIGNTYDGSYEINGNRYQFKNHGLIRYATLQCIEEKAEEITFELKSDEETLKAYPFAFTYRISYILKENVLSINYEIINDDKKDMPFTFGLHPGFNVPLCEDEKFEDYSLIFDQEENLKQLIFDVNKKEPHHYIDKSMKEWNLNYKDMDEYATLIYKNMSSDFVTLKGKQGHGVKMSIKGFPFLAIWSPKERAPFLCIEPWYSHADFEKVEVPFAQRCGMMTLKPQEVFATSYTIEVF